MNKAIPPLQLIRVFARYALATALAIHAFVLLFPLELPFPGLSQLNTDYGDFLPAEIFRLTVGIAKAGYQAAIGLALLGAVLLLFFRRTATLGALVASGLLLNIVLANYAYDLGDQLFSLFLFAVSVFILSYDLPRMYRLMLEKPVTAGNSQVLLTEKWQQQLRIALKALFIVFLLGYGSFVFASYQNKLKAEHHEVVKNIDGLYNVKEFRINNTPVPYSKTNPLRWQDVVFEKAGKLSISAGTAPRKYYSYSADTTRHILNLESEAPGKTPEKITLNYSRPDSVTLLLSGTNGPGDTVHAVLEKINKKYLLIEGRRKPIKL